MIACAVLLHPNKLFASVAGTSLPYQTYRDFAENKGEFRPGAENVPLYDKNGNPVTTLNKAPMIDFSSNDSTGLQHWFRHSMSSALNTMLVINM